MVHTDAKLAIGYIPATEIDPNVGVWVVVRQHIGVQPEQSYNEQYRANRETTISHGLISFPGNPELP
jgi:hypothetical protein